MLKKIGMVMLALVLVFSVYGCSKKDEDVKVEDVKVTEESEVKKNEEVEGPYDFQIDELGVKMMVSEYWKEEYKYIIPLIETPASQPKDKKTFGNIAISFIPVETINMVNEKSGQLETQEEIDAFNEDVMATLKPIVNVLVYEKADTENLVTGFAHNYKIGEIAGLVYYFAYDDMDTENLSEHSKDIYGKAYEGISTLKETVIVYDIKEPTTENSSVTGKMPEFETVDMNGNAVNQSIFSNSTLTMVNIWATYCGPCIDEMPDLEALSHELKELDAQLVGIVSDGQSEDTQELAQDIIDAKGVTFTNIIPDENIMVGLLYEISAVPTTIFVDSEGNIVGEAVIGSRPKEDYMAEVKKVLESLK